MHSCWCDYCTSDNGPYYTDDGMDVLHYCEYCNADYVVTCPGCEFYEQSVRKLKEREFWRNN